MIPKSGKTPPKVLIISFVPIEQLGSGTANLSHQLLDFLWEHDVDAEMLVTSRTASQRPDIPGYKIFRGLSFQFLEDISPALLYYVARRARSYSSILIVGLSMSSILTGLLFRIIDHRKTIVHIPQFHQEFVFRSPISRILFLARRWIFEYLLMFTIVRPTVIVFNKKEESLVKRFSKKIVRRSLGIDIRNTPVSKRDPVFSPKKETILLHVGEIHRNKFPVFAIDVMELLTKLSGAKIKLNAVGRIHQRHYTMIKTLISERRLSHVIHFAGVVSEQELSRYMDMSDIFVLFSASESGPFNVLEAMYYGVPVVSTRVGFVPELEAQGMLLGANYGDAAGMADKIIQLSRDIANRKKLAKEAQQKLSLYDRNIFLETVYSQLLPDKGV